MELCGKKGYEENKDYGVDIRNNKSISFIGTECSGILSQGRNWGTFTSVLDREGKEFKEISK